MSQSETKTSAKPKTHQPRRYKVILLNDDYTPEEFVVSVLRKVFRLTTDQASRVIISAHMKGSCVVVVLSKDIAETKAQEANEMEKQEGYPLEFTTEPEE
jgi:ATP-dependent Clp protease adaptor protein ClpS